VLAEYLAKRDRKGMALLLSKVTSPGARSVVREALRQFDDLEAQRQELKPKPAVPGESATTETAVTNRN
jgi:hypothetical protein